VKVVTSGAEKTKISLAFTATASGRKLPIIIVLPRKNPLKNYVAPANVIIVYKSQSKTFDSEVIKSGYIDRVLLPYMLQHSIKKSCIYLDNATCHKRKDVLQKFSSHKIKPTFFPSRTTKFFQVCYLKFFKSYFCPENLFFLTIFNFSAS